MRVLLIDIDSLRPDHLGCYGYDRETSPTIDSIAAEGVQFERCYVSDSPCLPSRTALATGRAGIKNGVVTHHGTGQWYDEPGAGHSEDPDRPLAFRRLSEAGIHTTTVTSFAKRHLAYHFTAGFRESIQPTAHTGGETAADVTQTATDWLERNAAGDDWLLHVNYWDVHHPYADIDPYLDDVRSSGDCPSWPDEDALATHAKMTGTRCGALWPTPEQVRAEESGEAGGYRSDWYGDHPMPASFDERADVEHLSDGYDASIRKVDAAVAELLDTLERAGVREKTAIVVTADHGDALGEHGIYAEHAFPHPACQRVPMIVSWPGLASDRCVDEHVYQFDLVATLCELADLDVPDDWDAEPFTAAIRGEPFDGRDFLVCGHGIYTFGRAVYEDDWVYIRLLHPGAFSVPGLYNDTDLPDGGLELLHDLDSDPHQIENLIEECPAVADRMRARYDSWVTDALKTTDTEGEDPLARMATTDGPFLYIGDLKALESVYEERGASERQLDTIRQAESANRN